MSRSLLRSALELRTPLTRLPPSYLLPIRALSTTSASTPAATPKSSAAAAAAAEAIHIRSKTASAPPTSPVTSSSIFPDATPGQKQKGPPPAPTGPEARQSLKQLLPLLRAQPAHYATVHIHSFPYLVQAGDRVRLPFRMPGALPGDVLRLNRVSVLGSRDYTLRAGGDGYVDESLFECRATVVGVESEPMRIKEKTKRRNRKTRTVRSKHKYTVLSISELKVL